MFALTDYLDVATRTSSWRLISSGLTGFSFNSCLFTLVADERQLFDFSPNVRLEFLMNTCASHATLNYRYHVNVYRSLYCSPVCHGKKAAVSLRRLCCRKPAESLRYSPVTLTPAVLRPSHRTWHRDPTNIVFLVQPLALGSLSVYRGGRWLTSVTAPPSSADHSFRFPTQYIRSQIQRVFVSAPNRYGAFPGVIF